MLASLAIFRLALSVQSAHVVINDHLILRDDVMPGILALAIVLSR